MKITLGTTYFNNYEDIQRFIEMHLDYVDELIIVDDGSHVYPLRDYVTPTEKIKLYEVTENIGFNSHGCRNLIMTVASNDWVLLMDSDRCFVNPSDIETIKNKKLKKNVRYEFMNDGGVVSCNDFVIHRDHFFSVGGYDEEAAGYRYGDRYFFMQLLNFGEEQLIHRLIIRYEDRGSTYLQKDERLRDLYGAGPLKVPVSIARIIWSRVFSPTNTKPILQFPWRQITSDAVTTNHK